MKKSIVLFFISLIILCASATAFSTAWFISSDQLRIDAFELSVNASDDLLISLTNEEDGYTDKIDQSISDDDFFIPVSSMMSSNWMKTHSHNPVFYSHADRNYNEMDEKDGVKYVIPKESIATEGFYSQEFYLKSEAPKIAYLDTSRGEMTFIKPDILRNEAHCDELISSGDSQNSKDEIIAKLNNLVKSLRISVLIDREDSYDYKIFDPYKEENVLYGGVVDSDCLGMYDVKVDTSENVNYEVLYGEVSNREKILYSYNEETNRKQGSTWIDSGHYANTKTIDLNASIANGVNIAEEQSMTFEENNNIINNLMNSLPADSEKTLLIPLDSNVPTRIVVSIYMEGWDKDNIDSTMGASFNAQLTFGILDRHII